MPCTVGRLVAMILRDRSIVYTTEGFICASDVNCRVYGELGNSCTIFPRYNRRGLLKTVNSMSITDIHHRHEKESGRKRETHTGIHKGRESYSIPTDRQEGKRKEGRLFKRYIYCHKRRLREIR